MLKTIESLNKLVVALQQSLPAVVNAFFLVLLVMCMYSIVSNRLFGHIEDAGFDTFGTSMLRFWLLLTMDNACAVSQTVFSSYKSPYEILGIALFFITFQLLVSYVLMNIVMAVLLDEFIASSSRARAAHLAADSKARAWQGMGPLDPLLETLVQFIPKHAMEQKLQVLFELIDEDGSGSVDLAELQQGLTRMELLPQSGQDDDDLEALMAGRGLQPQQRMTFQDFRQLIQEELEQFKLRSVGRALQVKPVDADMTSEERVPDKVNAAMRALFEALDTARRVRPIERRLAAFAPRLAALEAAAGPPLPAPDDDAASWRSGPPPHGVDSPSAAGEPSYRKGGRGRDSDCVPPPLLPPPPPTPPAACDAVTDPDGGRAPHGSWRAERDGSDGNWAVRLVPGQVPLRKYGVEEEAAAGPAQAGGDAQVQRATSPMVGLDADGGGRTGGLQRRHATLLASGGEPAASRSPEAAARTADSPTPSGEALSRCTSPDSGGQPLGARLVPLPQSRRRPCRPPSPAEPVHRGSQRAGGGASDALESGAGWGGAADSRGGAVGGAGAAADADPALRGLGPGGGWRTEELKQRLAPLRRLPLGKGSGRRLVDGGGIVRRDSDLWE